MSSDHDELVELLAGIEKGCCDSWQRLVLRFGPIVRRVAAQHLSPRVQSRVHPSDVVQVVWGELYNKVMRGLAFSPVQFLSLLKRMAMEEAFKSNRAHLDRAKRSSTAEAQLSAEVPDRTPTPEQVAEATDEWLRLLGTFSCRDRQVLILLRAGHTYAEVAEAANLCERTIARIVQDAREIETARRSPA